MISKAFYVVIHAVMSLKYQHLPKFRKDRKSYPKFKVLNKMKYDKEYLNEIEYYYNEIDNYIFNESIPVL